MDLIGINTEELIDELMSRYDYCVFGGVQELTKPDEDGEADMEGRRHFVGNHHACLGLCCDLQADIIEEQRREELGE